MRYRLLIIMLCGPLVLAGCWSNQELDDTVLVEGVGIGKGTNGDLQLVVELIKPTGQTGGSESEEQGSELSLVLDNTGDTLLEIARDFIRYSKRRLNFTHSLIWIVENDLAKKKEFTKALDILRRDKMLRLNSFLFISEADSDLTDILSTPTLYEDLTSTELVSALEQTQFSMHYATIKLREFYELLEEPINSAYVPVIKTKQVGEQTITVIEGTAVIRDNRMIGKLNLRETIGLKWLLERVKGGTVSVSTGEKGKKAGIEISDTNTTLKTRMEEGQLQAQVNVEVEGTLSDNMTDGNINEAFFKEVEQKVSKDIKQTIQDTLDTLQNDFKADITGIGVKLYQTHPKQWNAVASDWHNDIFPNADISVHVDTNLTHQGLINESIDQNSRKPHNNPYRFGK
ncbi:Ger(x)C family spore germination protein [Lentibacillus cibarius]|uniref:Ger(X)C family spore germination protein n=1 Tax=Lentibacillus cibarius TaxID=2583219 RepID=A0A5S3QLW9_9BACI|nr:Ger(x)C family spore germination protein [Lentibacillus cibarius]TMN22944.1 Ger(x)C family spore germination protein [Lentibacillus cibarius]